MPAEQHVLPCRIGIPPSAHCTDHKELKSAPHRADFFVAAGRLRLRPAFTSYISSHSPLRPSFRLRFADLGKQQYRHHNNRNSDHFPIAETLPENKNRQN